MTTAPPTPTPTMATGRLMKPAVSNPDWRDDALCAKTDPELFFPVGRSRAANKQREAAKRVCGRCPVRAECLSWAYETGQYVGVLGGMDEDERWGVRRPGPGRSASSGPVRPAFDRAVAARDVIEAKVAAGWSMRAIGLELGVSHHAVSKARQFYLAEEAASGSASGEVDAV